jgi:branched-chain amino acid transport system ATP-binding protein
VSGPLLALEGVHAGYGPFRVLFDVGFELDERARLAVVGPNGAGKTTLARVVTALVAPSRGEVRFRGRPVRGLAPSALVRAGVVHLVEGRSVFASLSVEENLVLCLRPVVGRRGLRQALERAYAAFPRLGERRGQLAGSLSGGEQRMLALARVLAAPPALLVADEVALGLAPGAAGDVEAALGSVAAAGTALLLLEPRAERAMRLASEAIVLTEGRVRWRGPAPALPGALAEALGAAGAGTEPAAPPPPGPPPATGPR